MKGESVVNNIKKKMKTRARLARGLVNALRYDIDYICSDIDTYDVLCMNESIKESIKESKNTIEKLIDNITELEYLLYLIKNESN